MQYFLIYIKLLMLLIMIYFSKNLQHINLAPQHKTGYGHTLQTESNVSLIKILDLYFRLSKVVCHKAQFLVLFCSYYL